jgi:xanthine dehydrogenase accessory factor
MFDAGGANGFGNEDKAVKSGPEYSTSDLPEPGGRVRLAKIGLPRNRYPIGRLNPMRERTQILEFWQKLREKGEPAVLATVVRTEGSSYRLPGARLLLSQNGHRVGSVSGGCLEDDIVKKAWWLTTQGPVLRKYDTTPDGEIATDGYGLGCNGVIYVLLERLLPESPTVLELLADVHRERHPATIAHLLSPAAAIGQRLTVDADDTVTHNLDDTSLPERLLAEARKDDQSSRLLKLRPGCEAFFEKLAPPTHLLIFGAGDDAVPLSQFAHYLGWQVTVLDGRAHYARREKFPSASRVVVRNAGSPPPPIDPWTVAVVMTHSYSQDLDVLRTLAGEPLHYLGVLGPRNRTMQMLAELESDREGSFPALHAPMGLDLGGDGPEPVALAALAEIQSVLNGRSGGFLRNRSGPIHSGDEQLPNETSWVRSSIACA